MEKWSAQGDQEACHDVPTALLFVIQQRDLQDREGVGEGVLSARFKAAEAVLETDAGLDIPQSKRS
jgi:hypothetical protein